MRDGFVARRDKSDESSNSCGGHESVDFENRETAEKVSEVLQRLFIALENPDRSNWVGLQE
jgi:hypothetical protein